MDRNSKKVVSTKLANTAFRELEEIAESENCSNSEIARRAILQYLQKDAKDESAEITKKLDEMESRLSDRIKQNYDRMDQWGKGICEILEGLQKGTTWIINRLNIKKKPTTTTTTTNK
jgi:predicted transcriptional regulator